MTVEVFVEPRRDGSHGMHVGSVCVNVSMCMPSSSPAVLLLGEWVAVKAASHLPGWGQFSHPSKGQRRGALLIKGPVEESVWVGLSPLPDPPLSGPAVRPSLSCASLSPVLSLSPRRLALTAPGKVLTACSLLPPDLGWGWGVEEQGCKGGAGDWTGWGKAPSQNLHLQSPKPWLICQ